MHKSHSEVKCFNIMKKISVGLLALIMLFLSPFSLFSVKGDENLTLSIIKQPESMACDISDDITFSLKAKGEGVTYQWQLSDDNGKTWSNSRSKGRSSSTLYLTVTSYISKCIYRCCLTDKYGNTLISDVVSVILPDKSLTVTRQPEDALCNMGEEFTFSVKAEGTDIKYQWQLSDDNGKTWSNSRSKGKNSSTLYLTLTSYISKCIYRCCLTDKYGNTLYSNSVKIIVKSDIVQITFQPANCEANTGDKAVFAVTAQGKGLSYNWQYSSDGGEKWTNGKYMPSDITGVYTDTLTVPVTSYRKTSCVYRCVITDSYGNQAISDIVRIVDVINKEKSFIVFTDGSEIEGLPENAEVLRDADYFSENAKISVTDKSLSLALDTSAGTDDVLLLCFTAYAEESCGKFDLKISGSSSYSGSFTFNTQKTAYYLPVKGIKSLSTLKIKLTTTAQNVYIGNFSLVNCNQAKVNTLKTGLFLLDDQKETVYYEESAIAEKATAMLADENYVYAAHYGVLTIYKAEPDGALTALSALSGLGNTRDMNFCNGGKGIVITSRENGVYFVDISDKKAPQILSNHTTLELATGLCVSGDYAFIASRYYGVEVLDISDLSSPKLCSVISDKKEFYDCEISDGYLYISSWAEKRIDIYNVKDAANPYFVKEILVDGQPGGLDISDGILCVATGYSGRNTSSLVTSPGYGTGNGMEIYDVSDPKNPQWLSTSKIDGRYRNGSYDHWKVKINGNYAYYSATYPGIYIYDISNPKSPQRVDHLTIRIPKNSSNYHKITNENYLFPYDSAAFQQGPVMGYAVGNGYLYFSDVFTGLYAYRADWIETENSSDGGYISYSQRENKTVAPQIDGYKTAFYDIGNSVYSVAACETDERIFAACGDGGIAVLNSDFEVISRARTAGAAVDLKILDNYLIAAESNEGIGIYEISADGLQETGRWKLSEYNFTVTDFELSPDKTMIFAQSGWTKISVIDITDLSSPKTLLTSKTGTMYSRNACTGLVGGKYIGFADSANIRWIDASDGKITNVNLLTNRFASQTNGVAACGDWAVTLYNDGYVYYNPEQVSQSDIASLKVKKIDGVKTFRGKVACNSEVLAASYGYGKMVTLADVSDIDNPVLISQFEVDGYPDIAHFADNKIIIPIRCGGLVVIEKESV